MTDSAKNTLVLRVADLSQNAPTRFALSPDASALAGIAKDLNLLGLRKLTFQGDVRGFGKADWQLKARLGATVTQPCVVTLDPVTTRIETDVERRFIAEMARFEEDDEEIEMPEDENAEPLGREIDVTQVMCEALALNLPLYPRVDGVGIENQVFTEPGKTAMTDEDARPFAGLAGLRDKLSGEGEN